MGLVSGSAQWRQARAVGDLKSSFETVITQIGRQLEQMRGQFDSASRGMRDAAQKTATDLDSMRQEMQRRMDWELARITTYGAKVVLLTEAAAAPDDAQGVGNTSNAARSSGANTYQIMRQITLPLVLPAILAGGLLAFIGALANCRTPRRRSLPLRGTIILNLDPWTPVPGP